MILSAVQILAGIAALGIALIITATAIKTVLIIVGAMALSIKLLIGSILLLKVVFLALVSPIVIVGVAILFGIRAFLLFTEAGQKVVKFFTERFATLGAITRKAMNGVMDALRGGNILLAAKILWTGLKLIWFTGTQELQTIFFTIKNSITKVVINIIASVQRLFTNMWAGIRKIFQKGKEFITSAFLAVQQVAANIKFKLGIIDEKEFAEITNRLIDTLGEARDQQARDLKDIEIQQQRALARIQEAQEAGLTGADVIKDQSIQDIKDTIGRLTNELSKSSQKAKDLNIEAEKTTVEIEKGADGQDRFNKLLKDIARKRIEFAGGGTAQEAISGTFSAKAVQALAIGGAKIQERILDANKQTAKNTGKLLQMGGLNFS